MGVAGLKYDKRERGIFISLAPILRILSELHNSL
jgi:hypothetical protein